jgi:cytoskeleton protein RodZ
VTETNEGPGAALKAARVSLDISAREVAEALNLPLRVVEAMEDNDYSQLPKPVFTRGYLRSYARLIDLDPEAIVSRHPETVDDPGTAKSRPVNPTAEWVRRNPLWILSGIALVLVLVAGMLVLWLLPAAQVDEVQTPSRQSSVPAAPARSSSPPVGVAGESPATAIRTPLPATVLEVEDSTVQDLISVAGGQGSAAEPAPALDGDAPQSGPRRITPLGDDLLVFTFTEDCWVQVYDAAGGELYSDLNRAGGTLELTGGGPFRILLGYAPGVELEFNGEPVALNPYTRKNLAKLVLGQ